MSVLGKDHGIASALRCDAHVGSKVLHLVVGSEELVVMGDEVWYLEKNVCCRSTQDLSCLLVRVAKWGIAVVLRVVR